MTMPRLNAAFSIMLCIVIALAVINKFDISPPGKWVAPTVLPRTTLPQVSVDRGEPREARWQSQTIIVAPTLAPYVPPTLEPITVVIEKNCTTAEWKAGTEGCTFIVDAVDVNPDGTPNLGPVTSDTPPIQQEPKHCTTAEWQKLSAENYPNPSGCTFITDVADEG